MYYTQNAFRRNAFRNVYGVAMRYKVSEKGDGGEKF
jgi:hypothetical protein